MLQMYRFSCTMDVNAPCSLQAISAHSFKQTTKHPRTERNGGSVCPFECSARHEINAMKMFCRPMRRLPVGSFIGRKRAFRHDCHISQEERPPGGRQDWEEELIWTAKNQTSAVCFLSFFCWPRRRHGPNPGPPKAGLTSPWCFF